MNLTIHYVDKAENASQETPVTGAEFSVYKVADVSKTARMLLTEEFAKYKDTVTALSTLEDLDQTGWADLASTLSQYVAQDKLEPVASG